jgi:hypothetical protein
MSYCTQDTLQLTEPDKLLKSETVVEVKLIYHRKRCRSTSKSLLQPIFNGNFRCICSIDFSLQGKRCNPQKQDDEKIEISAGFHALLRT